MPDTRAKNKKYREIYLSLQQLVLFSLKIYSYCQAQSSQASARLSGFIITWSNLTPHPPQPGIVVRWCPMKLKFATVPYFNITKDITDTNSHQLFSKIHNAQINCLTLVPKIKNAGKYILAYNRLYYFPLKSILIAKLSQVKPQRDWVALLSLDQIWLLTLLNPE